MTIDTQSAAPQGAAPAFVTAAGPGARSGDVPATNDLFAMLVAQLSGSGPAAQPVGPSRAALATPLTLGPFASVGVVPGVGTPVPVTADHGPRRTSGAPATSEANEADEAGEADDAGNVPADVATTTADAIADPTSGVAVPVWLWPLAELQPRAPAAAEISSSGSGQVDGADVSTAAAAALTDEGPMLGRQQLFSGAGGIARNGTATARTSFGSLPQASAPAVPPADVPAVSGAAPVSINASSASTQPAALATASGASTQPAALSSHETGSADAHDLSAAPVATASHATRATSVPGTVRSSNHQSAPNAAPVPVGLAATSAQGVQIDSPAAQDAGSDLRAVLRRAADGARTAEQTAQQTATDGAPRAGAVAGLAATDSNGGSGNNAARGFSDRSTGSAETFADRASDAVASLLGRATDATSAVPSHAERAALAAGRGLDVAVPGAAPPGTPSTAFVQPASDIQFATIPDEGDVRRQIVQAVRLQWRDGIGDARLTLQPDYLGDVTISLRVEQGSVTAHLNAESADVRAWMSANEPSLRQGLAEHGLTLDRLIVSEEPADATPDRESRRQRAPQEDEKEPPRAPRRRPETATFEMVV